jgi:hypothetical protein
MNRFDCFFYKIWIWNIYFFFSSPLYSFTKYDKYKDFDENKLAVSRVVVRGTIKLLLGQLIASGVDTGLPSHIHVQYYYGSAVRKCSPFVMLPEMNHFKM